MAFVTRISTHFCSVLNTFYCKCIINATTLRTLHDVQNEVKNNNVMKEPMSSNYSKMINFRQAQASRSIVVKLNHFNNIRTLKSFCSSYGRIVNIFPYITVHKQKYVLIEFEKECTVTTINDRTAYKAESGFICSKSRVFSYANTNTSSSLEDQSVTDYGQFKEFDIPLTNNMKKELQKSKCASKQMMLLYQMLQISELDIRLRFYTANELTYYLSKLFSNITVIPFGSSVNGFGQTGCDLDLFCQYISPEVSTKRNRSLLHYSRFVYLNNKYQQKQFLLLLSSLMEICIPDITDMQNILNARVPIIRFRNLHTNTKCDLSCCNTSAWYMSELLHFYGEWDNRVRPLVFIIRKWAKVQNITKEVAGRSISNFSLTMLIIFYLQRKNILPSLSSLHALANERKNCKNALDTIKLNNWDPSNKESLYVLLRDFFEYYITFDFKMQAISIHDAEIKRKESSYPLYIYNPFDTLLNICPNVNDKELFYMISCFGDALNLLKNEEQHVIVKLLSPSKSFDVKNIVESLSCSSLMETRELSIQ